MLSRLLKRLPAITLICAWLTTGVVFGATQPPLSRVPVPEPPNLGQFLRSDANGQPTAAARAAAIRLGKALFWDMQAGSDGVQACASCHFNAGADNRLKNQLHPGPDSIFGNNSTVVRTFNPLDPLSPVVLRASGLPQFAPNYTLQTGDFPFFRVFPVNARLVIDPLTGFTSDAVTSLRDTNDVAGSQGIRLNDFLAINAGSDIDNGTPLTSPVFQNFRQVTGRNAPSVINAVFNFTNFWDGRANNIFNGETPFGPLDQDAGIWIDDGGATLVKQKVAIPNASLASQAVGPPLNSVEMSFRDRTFPELGRKMLGLTPLAKQLVHPNDSVLGPDSRGTLQGDGSVTGNRGLNTNYGNMIKAAFQDNLTSNKTVSLPTKAVPGGEQFTQIEANFPLFFGLAIQLYEATLVSDRTPFDIFRGGNQNAMSVTAQRGFNTFDSKCAVCHSGSEFTTAVTGSNTQVAAPDGNPVVFANNSSHNLIQLNQNQATFASGLSDTGFFNIGVRPTTDDPGRGGTAPSGLPLSFSRLAVQAAQSGLPFAVPKLPAGFPTAQPDAVNGSFKTPGLRNVELTAPYFHNGGARTLDEVVEFYTRGGNFPGNPELAFAMQPIGKLRGDSAGRSEVVEFMKTLTDERVRQEKAPFDHPELLIPSGDPADTMITLQPTGGARTPVQPGLTLNPVVTPTVLTGQTISGTISEAVKTTATVEVSVNNGPAAAATINCVLNTVGTCDPTSTWSFTAAGLAVGANSITVTATDVTADGTGAGVETATANIQLLPTATISGTPQIVTKQTNATLTVGGTGVVTYQFKLDGGAFSGDIPVATQIVLTGLTDGTHTVAVTGKDAAGNQQFAASATTATWTVKANPPVLTMNPVATPVKGTSLTINGTVELGRVPTVRADTSVVIGPVSVVGGSGIATWSTLISGLKAGTTNITVTATDIALNETVRTAAITVIVPDGNLKGTGSVDITDALKALRMAIGLVTPTAGDLLHGDVAPLVNGAPAPDGKIDVADALVILRKAVGLVNF